MSNETKPIVIYAVDTGWTTQLFFGKPPQLGDVPDHEIENNPNARFGKPDNFVSLVKKPGHKIVHTSKAAKLS